MSVFGVDFGNLNSTVAITRYGGVDIVTNEVSKRETTTIVSFLDDERFIGEQGLDRYVRNAQNTVFLVKRFLGMQMNDPNLEFERRFLTCEIKGDDKNKLMFGVNYCGEMCYFYPEQILAMMLQKLRTYVNEAATTDARFPADVKDCVITSPSYYTADQRRLIYQAAEIAGLHCMSVVNETTASSVDYGIFRGLTLKETEEAAQIVGILDIGYGATDFCVTKFWKGNCKVVAHVFDRNNGTRDIDYHLYLHMAGEVKKRYGIDVTGNKRTRLRLLQACERLKYLLSANQTAPFNVENLMDVDVNIPNFDRGTLEECAKEVPERVRKVIEHGLAECGIPVEDFHSVEMIGGGCRIPMMKRLAEEMFKKPPSFTLNASETTARGAAIIAAMLSPKFQVREFKVAEQPTYPVLLGYYVENPKSPSSVPFLPDVNKVVTLLGAKDTYPKLLEVTVPRSGPFKLYAFYDPENHNVKEGILQGHYIIGEWEIGAPNSKPQGQIRETKVRINLKPDGLLQVEGAWAIDVFEIEETVEKKPAEAAPAAPAAADGAAGEGSTAPPAQPPAPVEKEVVKKKKQKLIETTVKPNLDIIGQPGEKIVEFRKQEADMHSRDASIVRTREKKNELESYILDYRPRVSADGMLADYVTAEQRTKFIKQCDDDEQWLYDDGDHATWDEYNTRVQNLRAIGDAAYARYKNRDDTEFALKGFNERMKAASDSALAFIGKAAHITEDELRAASQAALDAVAWGQKEVQALLAAPKTQDAAFTPKQLEEKAVAIEQSTRALLSRPAPPPPKPAPAAADANASASAAPPDANASSSSEEKKTASTPPSGKADAKGNTSGSSAKAKKDELD